MTKITFKGQEMKTIGELPRVSDKAPDFVLTNTDLQEVKRDDFRGKKIVLNIFPSVDTSTCARGMRKFNEYANTLDNIKVLGVSMDLPFALKRFCGAEGLENVLALSAFRHPDFGKNYGVTIVEGPLAGLLSRAVVVLDQDGKVIYTQQVPEVTNEVDYEDVMKALF